MHCKKHRATPPDVLLPCSQKISFGVMSTVEVVNTAELHVYERPLYSVRGPLCRQAPHVLAPF